MSLANLPRRAHIGIAFVVAAAFLFVLVQGINATDAWGQEGAGNAEDFGTLAEGLFTTHVIALEVLGVLLTAVMIGAMIIARPLGGQPDTIHYATKRRGQDLERIQAVSEVDRNLGSGSFGTPAAVVGKEPDVEDGAPEPEPVVAPEPTAEAPAEGTTEATDATLAEEPQEPAAPAETEPTQDLSKMTVAQLKELAAEQNIDLTGKKLKADIIAAIEEAST